MFHRREFFSYAASLSLVFVFAATTPSLDDAVTQNRPDADQPSGTDRVRWTNTRLQGSPDPPPQYTVEQTFTKIEWKAPLYLAPEPGTDQLWVVLQGDEKLGAAQVLRVADDPDTEHTATLLEMEGRLIYGLTFHPEYEANGLVFVFSNGPRKEQERTNRISRFSVGRREPFELDASSEKVIIEWRSMGHDGGDLAFGRDGMLYITAGDGTSDSDTWNSGQDVTNLLATLIRIDVDNPPEDQPYAVPPDNPFVNLSGARPEIWAYGFRNPWRMSIDPKTGDVWVGNNGQDLWETAYLVRRGDNFGWSVYEGNHPFYPNRKRGPTPIVPPTIEHHHSEFRSLTGGVVYYGEKLPELNGVYVYGDYSTGKIWGARHRDGHLVWHQELTDTSLQIVAFRVDQHGELLVADIGGGIYRLVPRPPETSPTKFPTRLSDTGLFASVGDHRVESGLISYSINAPGWADGATAERFIAVSGDSKIKYRPSRGWDFPDGAALVQTLSLQLRPATSDSHRRLETRVLLKQQGEWAGYSYRWNEEQTDAVLVGKDGEGIELEIRDDSVAGGVRRQAWRVPSRAECLACHSRAANFVLGPTELQMNRNHDYGGQQENQLAALHRLGVLIDWPVRPPKQTDNPQYAPGKLGQTGPLVSAHELLCLSRRGRRGQRQNRAGVHSAAERDEPLQCPPPTRYVWRNQCDARGTGRHGPLDSVPPRFASRPRPDAAARHVSGRSARGSDAARMDPSDETGQRLRSRLDDGRSPARSRSA
jgi:glucose/arabinose dehydrogenase